MCVVEYNQPRLNAAPDSRLLTRTDTQPAAASSSSGVCLPALSVYSVWRYTATASPPRGACFGDWTAVGGLAAGCNRSFGSDGRGARAYETDKTQREHKRNRARTRWWEEQLRQQERGERLSYRDDLHFLLNKTPQIFFISYDFLKLQEGPLQHVGPKSVVCGARPEQVAFCSGNAAETLKKVLLKELRCVEKTQVGLV